MSDRREEQERADRNRERSEEAHWRAAEAAAEEEGPAPDAPERAREREDEGGAPDDGPAEEPDDSRSD